VPNKKGWLEANEPISANLAKKLLELDVVHPTVAVFSTSVANVGQGCAHAGGDAVGGYGNVVELILHSEGFDGANHRGGAHSECLVELARLGGVDDFGY
jgi:hypothetical protein